MRSPILESHTVTLSDNSTIKVFKPDWIKSFKVVTAMFECAGGVGNIATLYRDSNDEVSVVLFAAIIQAIADRPGQVAFLYSIVSDRDVEWFMREDELTPDDMMDITEAVFDILPFGSLFKRMKRLFTTLGAKMGNDTESESEDGSEPNTGDSSASLDVGTAGTQPQ